MSVKLPTEHHLEFLSLKAGHTGSFESTLVKIPHCWKSHVAAHFIDFILQLMNKKDTCELRAFSHPSKHLQAGRHRPDSETPL